MRIGGTTWERLTEALGTLFEQQGLKNIELGAAAFTPADAWDPAGWAAALGEFVRKNPVATDYALYAEYVGPAPNKLTELRAVVVDKAGALVWAERQTAQDDAYVVYGDYRFNPEHWEQGYVHVVVCDRQARPFGVRAASGIPRDAAFLAQAPCPLSENYRVER